jgi:elongation factor Tu
VKVGDELEIVGLKPTLKTVCTGVEMFASCWTRGRLGTTWGAAARHQAGRGGAGPGAGEAGSITPHTKFSCEVYVLSKDEGGGTRRFFLGTGRSFTFGRRT